MSNASEQEPKIYQLFLLDVIKYLDSIDDHNNDTKDYSKPLLKEHFEHTYIFIILVYVLLIVMSVLGNVGILYHIFKNRLHEDSTYGFFINIALANILQVVFPLPLTLVVIIISNWIFGKFMCYFLPPMQDIETHVLMMSYLAIVIDRYLYLCNPRRTRIPSFVCSVGTWFFGVCFVLPLPAYTSYFDLEYFGEYEKSGRGPCICMANLQHDIHGYLKNLFVGTYALPLSIAMYFYVKSSHELKNKDDGNFPSTTQELRSFSRRRSTDSNEISLRNSSQRQNESATRMISPSNSQASYNLEGSEIDILKEKRTQRYLYLMLATFATCHCPLMILRLTKSSFIETYANELHIDTVYLIVVWLAFTSAVTTPCYYAAWHYRS